MQQLEVQHAAELKAQYHEVKKKFKTKFVQRLSALDNAFKNELKAITSSYNKVREESIMKDRIITQLGRVAGR